MKCAELGDVPDKCGSKPASEGLDALCAPDGAHAVEGRLVFLPVCGAEAIRLQARLDHVDGVDARPELYRG